LHGWLAEQLVAHWCLTGSHDWKDGQSAAELQPQLVPNRQACPNGDCLQSRQAAPVPQPLLLVPFAQSPLPQQPPWHGCAAGSHWLVHRCCAPSQAKPVGQSLCVLQPQKPPVVLAMHTEPIALPLHETQALPVEPHAVGSVPPAHALPAQQPPLHGCVALHAVVQVCVVVSQALPAGQSPALPHPHTPAMQP
jgi:hypothetical protein